MRIRKLAQDLGSTSEQVLGLLHGLGHTRYQDAEQQLPDVVAAQVRRNAPALKRVVAWSPPPPARAMRRLDDAPPTPHARPDAPPPNGDDAALLQLHLGGVRPLTPPARAAAPPGRARSPARPGPVPRGAPTAPATAPPTPIAPAPFTPAGAAPRAASPIAHSTPPRPPTAAPQPADLSAERAALIAEREALAAWRAAISTERELLQAAHTRELTVWKQEQQTLQAEVTALRARVEALQGVMSLRRALEARGLLGEDEMIQALRATAEARRARELLDGLFVADPTAFSAWLADRLLLVGPDETTPPGLVGVHVPAERGEGSASPHNRPALTRLATACLVRGVRRLVVIGGSGAAQRVLREGMDPRIELRLHPAPRGTPPPEVPPATPVALWADAADDTRLVGRYLEALRVPERDVASLCIGLVRHLEP